MTHPFKKKQQEISYLEIYHPFFVSGNFAHEIPIFQWYAFVGGSRFFGVEKGLAVLMNLYQIKGRKGIRYQRFCQVWFKRMFLVKPGFHKNVVSFAYMFN